LKGAWSTRQPFLPPSAHFDAIAPGSRIGDWCEASVLDACLCMSAYSTFFKGEAQFPLLERLCETGFERPEMERRRLLLGARLGRKTRAPSDNLRRASRDNLNPEFWRQFRPEIFRRRDAG
jgi:hypothetical protein